MGKTSFHGTDFTAYILVSNMVGLVHYSEEPYKYLEQLPIRARGNWGGGLRIRLGELGQKSIRLCVHSLHNRDHGNLK